MATVLNAIWPARCLPCIIFEVNWCFSNFIIERVCHMVKKKLPSFPSGILEKLNFRVPPEVREILENSRSQMYGVWWVLCQLFLWKYWKERKHHEVSLNSCSSVSAILRAQKVFFPLLKQITTLQISDYLFCLIIFIYIIDKILSVNFCLIFIWNKMQFTSQIIY